MTHTSDPKEAMELQYLIPSVGDAGIYRQAQHLVQRRCSISVRWADLASFPEKSTEG